jgi:DNA-binding CsgD family transcriptional regulator
MVWFDSDARYLDANGPSRLFLRRTLAEMRRLRAYDLLPPTQHAEFDRDWAAMKENGVVAGSIVMQVPDAALIPIDFCGIANLLPGAHLVVWMPTHWDSDELGVVEEDAAPRQAGRLSAREREVLTVLATGASVREISEQLALSPHTVKTHLRNAVQRLGARHRAHAIALALRDGEI